ncbi:MAG: hypothetical protein HY888_01220 [Deltaproteobacteria bacterium]|nr:hypothetical protein [Deltaproteobacteria bacterium]
MVRPATPLITAAIVFLASGNVLATSKYAQKYGISCKGCHSTGSDLNELGQKFWKNGHSFGDNTEQLEKFKQSTSGESKSKAAEPPGKSPEKAPTSVQGKTDTTLPAVEATETVPPPPETKVYKWKTDDGILHFSDTPEAVPQRERKSASGGSAKTITRTGFRPLSAIVPKTSQKAATAKPPKSASLEPVQPKQSRSKATPEKADSGQCSFEECMEQALVSMQRPASSDAAMAQFREAEEICTPCKKKLP